MDSQQIFDSAIKFALAGNIDEQCVDSLKLISESTESAEAFVRTMVSQEMETEGDLDAILPKLQELFERIADHSESAACIFMAYLWPIAAHQTGMHDVCNSIDLWLTDNLGSEITKHIRHIASSAECESTREHFRQLVALRS